MIMNCCEEETIEVLYNAMHGGFGLSEKAEKMYKEKLGRNVHSLDSRHSPLLLQIFHELGDEFNSKYCYVKIKKIPKKLENFYEIDEYDGLEEVIIDYYTYELTNTILRSTMNDNEKINKLKEIVLQRKVSVLRQYRSYGEMFY